jgi:hypothetical protein
MLRMSVIAVFVALLGTEANAAICASGLTHLGHTTIGGSLKNICYNPKTGVTTYASVRMTLQINGVPGSVLNGCATPDEPCLEVQCAIYGTVQLADGAECNPTTEDPLDSDCGIDGIAVCVNPRCHNSNNPDCVGNSSNGQPYTLETSVIQSGAFQQQECNRGKCKKSLEVEAQLSDDICINPNWEFQTFTPSEFIGQCCTCDYGFDSAGVCCGSRERVGNSCSIPGPTCDDAFRCEVDLSDYQGGDIIPYVCEEIPPAQP